MVIEFNRLLKVRTRSLKVISIDGDYSEIVKSTGVTRIDSCRILTVFFSLVPTALRHGFRALIKFLASLLRNVELSCRNRLSLSAICLGCTHCGPDVNILDLESVPRIYGETFGSDLQDSDSAHPYFVSASSDGAKYCLSSPVAEGVCNHILSAIEKLHPQRGTNWPVILVAKLDSQLNVGAH